MLRVRAKVFCGLVLLGGCGGGDDSTDPPSRWESLGQLPAQASALGNHSPLAVSSDEVFVGTADGVWRRSLSSRDSWRRSGLGGMGVLVVRRDPQVEATLYAAGDPTTPTGPTFFRSDDRGRNWIASQVWPKSAQSGASAAMADLAFGADNPRLIYANLSGAIIAISTDGGMTWAFQNGETEPQFGDPCVIHIVAAAPRTLVQGCEHPLDFAWVRAREIDASDPFTVGSGVELVGLDIIGNRRPNALASGGARPGTVYAGLEGALIALDGDAVTWVFRAEAPALPYAYISAIWVDPSKPDHIIFGGKPNGSEPRLSLFETNDHGATVRMLGGPAQFNDPALVQIAAENVRHAIVLISDTGATSGRRLLVYRFTVG